MTTGVISVGMAAGVETGTPSTAAGISRGTELTAGSNDSQRTTLQRHPHAVPVFATRPARDPAAIAIGDRMIAHLSEAGFTSAHALQLSRCLREFTIGHVLGWTAAVTGRSRKPAPDSPDYTPLAAAADAASDSDHFDIGLTAMLDGFARHPDSEPRREI
ncbi:TetR/AcrR family transcriptional regulator C-terminal domain-containing protein [Nocardia jiangxiensis]|uniref:TetR/AcrR family transcriptional regulator C-terminal domain-containing protein n=1 Tax=Nocardia jiangxiensis TaxID=282685 RepID=A0ABW6S170_9NOCA|nr:TetR/AcrR family transcriptional regulator C-terminal domain-containing protein [Nocardia jiangxiensis]